MLTASFRWLWIGQLISNLGTQCSLYGIGLWLFSRQGRLFDFALVALVVQLAKILAVPLLGVRLARWPRRRVMLLANGIGALCTVALAVQLSLWGHLDPALLLLLLVVAAMAEAVLVLSFASVIPLLVLAPNDLARANGLFVTADGLVLSVAPFAGSALVAATGLQGVLALDGLSFVVAMVCVLAARSPVLFQGQVRLPVDAVAGAQGRFQARLRQLWRVAASRAVLAVGTGMALVYAATEVMFPAWLVAGPCRSRLGWVLMIGSLGYLIGYQVWVRWAWRRSAAVLAISLILQSLILMGAGLLLFEHLLLIWYGGLLVFSISLPLALSALQTCWQRLASADQLPQLLAQRYRLEWAARLVAFVGAAGLVDGVLQPALLWPHWPHWLPASLGIGPGRPMAVGLGAMGWLLLLALWSQWRPLMRS